MEAKGQQKVDALPDDLLKLLRALGEGLTPEARFAEGVKEGFVSWWTVHYYEAIFHSLGTRDPTMRPRSVSNTETMVRAVFGLKGARWFGGLGLDACRPATRAFVDRLAERCKQVEAS